MQALEFVLAAVVVIARHVVDAGQGVGVVCGELWVDGLGRIEQLARAGEVGHIGVQLAGEDGVVFSPSTWARLISVSQ